MTETPVTTETLAEFTDRASAFLETVASRKTDTDTRAPFVWGKGSDVVELFKTTPPEEIEQAKDFRRAQYDAGFGWITGPTEYGGLGLPQAYQRAYERAERQFDVPTKAIFSISLGCVAPTINDFGTEEIKRYWLPRLYRGDILGCQLFSEPGAGSDLASVQTRAIRDGDVWRVNGQKVWTSRAKFSDLGLLLARISPEPRHKNLTMFVVDLSTPGIDIRPLREMTGGTEFNEIFITDVAIPDGQRLGKVGEGWQVAVGTLAHERNSAGDSGAGGGGILRMDRLVGLIRHFGAQDDPAVRSKFAEVYVGLTAAKASRARADAKRRSGVAPGPEASLGKLEMTRNLRLVADLVELVLKNRLYADTGDWGTFAWTDFLLGIPGMRVAGGTDEIQRNIISERVLGLPR